MNNDSLCSNVDSHLACSVGDSVEVVSDLEFLLEETVSVIDVILCILGNL